MSSRYFIHTLRRLLRVSSSYIPISFRTHRHLYSSIGTATALGAAVYYYSSSKPFSHPFILHAKALEKDLSYHGKRTIMRLLHWCRLRLSFTRRKRIISSCSRRQTWYSEEVCSTADWSSMNRMFLFRCVEEEKLDVNLRHPLGWTPLLVAVINNKNDCVQYLLSKGADPNQSDEFSNVQLMAKKLRVPAVQGSWYSKGLLLSTILIDFSAYTTWGRVLWSFVCPSNLQWFYAFALCRSQR